MVKRFLLFLIILIILPYIGWLLGNLAAELLIAEDETSWEMLGTPPSPADKIIQIHPLVVSTSSGQSYRYISSSEGWQLWDKELPTKTTYDFSELCAQVAAVPLEGMIDSKDSCVKWEMGSTYFRFAILENGSVWMWKKNIGGNSFSYLFYRISGAFVFFIIGVIIVIVANFRMRR